MVYAHLKVNNNKNIKKKSRGSRDDGPIKSTEKELMTKL